MELCIQCGHVHISADAKGQAPFTYKKGYSFILEQPVRSPRIYISCDSASQIYFPRSDELTHWMGWRYSECLENLVQLSIVPVNYTDIQNENE